MSSLSQALHLDYLPSSHSAFQDHAAHNAGWSACLNPTAHGVPVYPRVLPHSPSLGAGRRAPPVGWLVLCRCGSLLEAVPDPLLHGSADGIEGRLHPVSKEVLVPDKFGKYALQAA